MKATLKSFQQSVFAAVLWLACAGAIEGADAKAKEPSYNGKTLSQWVKQTRHKPGVAERLAGEAAKGLSGHPDGGLKQRSEAIGALGKMGAPAVPALVDLLKDPSTQDLERVYVMESLAEIGPAAKPALPHLLPLLGVPTTNLVAKLTESAAIKAVGSIGPEAIPALLKLLSDQVVSGKAVQLDRSYRLNIAEALGQMRPASDEMLLQMLSDTNAIAREVSLLALANSPALDFPPRNRNPYAPRADQGREAISRPEFPKPARTSDPRFKAAIERLLNDSNPVIRRSAEAALAKIEPPGERNERVLAALMQAASRNDDAAIRQILLAHPDVLNDHEDGSGWTALHAAAGVGRLRAVEALVKAKAALNIQNTAGRTPLHEAIRGGHHAIVKLLLESGADPNLRDMNGKSPLNHAVERKRDAIAELLRQHGATE
jgi:HEAT repeat protein